MDSSAPKTGRARLATACTEAYGLLLAQEFRHLFFLARSAFMGTNWGYKLLREQAPNLGYYGLDMR
jgi:hypothetical protein